MEEPRRIVRSFHIKHDDMIRHGYTRHCPRCEGYRTGHVTGVNHTAACRTRFRELFEGAGDGRVDRARQRQGDLPEGPAAAEAMEEDGPELPEAGGAAAAAGGAAGDAEAAQAPAEGAPAAEDAMNVGVVARAQATTRYKNVSFSRYQTSLETGGAAAAAGGAVSHGTAGTMMPLDSCHNLRPYYHINKHSNSHFHDPVECDHDETLVDTILKGATQPLNAVEESRRLGLIRGEPPETAGRKVTELFSKPRVNKELRKNLANQGVVAGTSFDIVIDSETGDNWDFRRPEDRRRCWRRLEDERPMVGY